MILSLIFFSRFYFFCPTAKENNYRGEKGGPFAHSQESHILSPTVDKPPQQPPGLPTLVKDLAMVGVPDTNSGCCGMLPATQTTRENGLSTGQIGGLIIKMNEILCNEFYPALESNKTRWFDTIWGAIQSLLCAEAISAAQNLAKTTRESPVNIQQPPATQSYAAITQTGLSIPHAQPVSCIQPVSQTLTQEMQVSQQNCPDLIKSNLQDPAKIVSMLNQAITKFFSGQVEAARALPSGDLVL